VFGERFEVVRKLGWGHFSTVWKVKDLQHEEYKTPPIGAMKVQKSAESYVEAAMDEIELLQCVAQNAGRVAGEKGKRLGYGGEADNIDLFNPPCVQLLSNFTHSGPNGTHPCMVFEALGENLLCLVKRFDYKGIPIGLVRRIARLLLEGLDFLHKECSIIHTDLKPENVLLSDPLSISINSNNQTANVGVGTETTTQTSDRKEGNTDEDTIRSLEEEIQNTTNLQAKKRLKTKLKNKKRKIKKKKSKKKKGGGSKLSISKKRWRMNY